MLAEPDLAFWLSLPPEDGNANRNGEVLGEKMSTALGRVPGSPPPRPAHCSVGHRWAGSPCPAPLGSSPLCLWVSWHWTLAQQCQDWAVPGVAGESRTPSIATWSP